jgi:cobalt-zinc-cadmium efflux system outer membrane protein
MIRRFSWFPVLVSALASATPTPAEAQELTLDRALAVMRREHPLLRAAEAELDAADADAVDAGLWTNPVLDASYNPGVVQSSYDPAGYFAWGITQFFEVADTPGARARVARLREDATRSDRDALARELEIEVEAGFVRACDAEARRALWQMRLEQLRTVDSIVEARVDAGAAPRYDLERFSIVLRSAEAALARADAELAAVRGELRATIGPGARTLAGPPVCDGLDAPPLPTREALEGALVERPDLVAARASCSRRCRDFRRVAVGDAGLRAAARRQFRCGAGAGRPLRRRGASAASARPRARRDSSCRGPRCERPRSARGA